MIAELVLAAWVDSIPPYTASPSNPEYTMTLCDSHKDVISIIQFVSLHMRTMSDDEYPASCEKVVPDSSWRIEVLTSGTRNGLILQLLKVETAPGVFRYGYGVYLDGAQ